MLVHNPHGGLQKVNNQCNITANVVQLTGFGWGGV